MKSIQSPIQFVVNVLPRSLKRSVRVADHPPPCTTEIINSWMYTSIASCAFMKSALFSTGKIYFYSIRET